MDSPWRLKPRLRASLRAAAKAAFAASSACVGSNLSGACGGRLCGRARARPIGAALAASHLIRILALPAALVAEAVGVALAPLGDVRLHDLLDGQGHGFAEKDEVPEHIAKLIAERVFLQRVPLEERFLDVLSHLARLAAQPQRGDQQPLA